MLKYNEFKQMLAEKIKDLLPVKYKNYVAEIYAINKINGKRDGLCLVDKGKSMSASPVIYVDELYAHYLKNGSLADTMKKAVDTVIKGFACTPTEYSIDLSKDNIVLVLINYERNKKLLESVPHIKFLDLAFVFRWIVKKNMSGIAGGLINNDIANAFGLTADELFEVAKENTRRILPPKVESLTSAIKKLAPTEVIPNDEDAVPVYILSNKSAIEGAACIVYTDILEQLKEKLGENLYLIPSSINEMLVVPQSFAKPDRVRNMVREVNFTTVAENEQLSDNVYLYDGEVRLI